MTKVLSIFGLLLIVAGAAQALDAGAAKVDITPPLGLPLNGSIERLGRSALSVHDPVSARCLYLSDGTTAVLWVTADLCFFTPELRGKVLELAPKEVPPENIILTATHTHSGPGGMAKSLVFRPVSGRFVPEEVGRVAGKIAQCMKEALDGRKFAVLGYAMAEQHDLSVNRRVPGGPTDSQLAVIRVNDADGHPIAILANVAAHPTTVNGKDDLLTISADYPGYYYSELERIEDDGCVAMFTNGAEGNQDAPALDKSGWARTEAMGKAVAQRVKDVADGIKCGDAKFQIHSSSPELPDSIVGEFFPRTLPLQALEINDLVINFVPGELLVEIGKDLRKTVMDHGYAAQMTVDLTNGYYAYFVPQEYYSKPCYETCMNFFGPDISDWFCREFSSIMSRGPAKQEPKPVPDAEVKDLNGATFIALKGTPREMGYQRGKAFQQIIQNRYDTRVKAPIKSGQWLPANPYIQYLPVYLREKLVVPAFAMAVRPLLQGASPGLFRELEGMADGAGMPFDAVWLTQCTPAMAAQPKMDKFFRGFFCTMMAAVGDRAGADSLLVGRNFDWDEEETTGNTDNKPVVAEAHPTEGHAFIQVGFAWSTGVFSGMNDAGLVVCAERMAALGNPAIEGEPIEFVLRELLQAEGKFATAAKRLENAPHLRGYHILLADPAVPEAAVFEYGATVNVRRPVKGLLLGSDPLADHVDPAAKDRYAAVSHALENEHIISAPKIRNALGSPDAGVWNKNTRYTVLFEPRTRSLRVAFPQGANNATEERNATVPGGSGGRQDAGVTASGAPGDYQRFILKGGGS